VEVSSQFYAPATFISTEKVRGTLWTGNLNWQTHEKVYVLPELKLNFLWISMGTMNIVGGFVKEGLAVNLKIRFCDFLGSDTKLRTDGPTDMTYTYGVLFCFVTKAPLPPPPNKNTHFFGWFFFSFKSNVLF